MFSLIVFIRLNAAAFIKIFVIQVRCFEGGVYLKCNLLFANNSMVADQDEIIDVIVFLEGTVTNLAI